MSLKLLLRDKPSRAFAIVSETCAFVIYHDYNAPSMQGGPPGDGAHAHFLVEFKALDHIDLGDYRVLRSSGVHGTLGLINVNQDVYLCLISGAVRVATVRPDETVQRIVSVDFYCINSNEHDFEYYQEAIDAYSTGGSGSHFQEHGPASSNGDAAFEHPCLELQKLLSSGTFYYSVDFDLTNRLQDRSSEESAFDIDSLDEAFLWNSYMIDPLIKFRSRLEADERRALDASRILTSAIRGFVQTNTIPPSSSPIQDPKTHFPSSLTLISRLSCRRAGTRFNARGIDDDGNTANFVETETVFWHPSGKSFSYAQIRGSVPVFWEQATGLLPGQQKIQITRSPEATQPAFDKHFEALENDYGTVHVLNLLSESKPGEAELTARYQYHVHHSPMNQVLDISGTAENRLLETQFDFHAETRGPGGYESANLVKRLIQYRADGFAYFSSEENHASEDRAFDPKSVVTLHQEGIFRTNCLDCLDRTNLIQTIISQMALQSYLPQQANADLWIRHSSLWADNGDALSKIYAGTGALKSSFTRHGKMSLAGAIADARKSATRLYINNFADKARQNTIDMLLGRLMGQSPVLLYDPIVDFVNAEIRRRQMEYATTDTIHMYIGTFNLNGVGDGVKENLAMWLCPEIDRSKSRPEIVAVAFQEMVELSPQQIMATDPVRRQAWENAVRRALNGSAQRYPSGEYVLLRSGQLVGAALMVFCTASALPQIKNIEGSVKKTGLSGMAGNKGAVAIRMDYANTRLCFVTAHLAAGFPNFEERNRDYRTISQGMRFQRNRSIEDHDAIIWAGDFNYRIGLSDDKVRRLIQTGDLEPLYQNDQLHLQMVAGKVFPFYSEAKITFPPTYKYKNGTDDYDISEKARIPAWCDRVLRKGDILKQLRYTTAPLRFSDHRPVYATFQCTVNVIDQARKEALSREIYSKRRQDLGSSPADAKTSDFNAEHLLTHDCIAADLPPASSDRRKWWLDNGLPARSDVRPPSESAKLNRKRPNNPFTSASDSDWIPMPVDKNTIHATGGIAGNEIMHENPRPSHTGLLSPQREGEILIEKHASSNTASQRDLGKADPTASTLAVRRKTAPPIPKKPELLLQSGEHRIRTENSHTRAMKPSTQGSSAMPSRTRQALSSNQDIGPTLPGTRLTKPRSEEDPPRLPPRRIISNTLDISGLMDTDNQEANLIPSLKPHRKG